MCSLVMVGRRRKEEESRRESILLCPEKVTQIRSRQKEAKNERSQQKGKSRIPFLYFYFFGLQTTAGTSLVQIRMKWSQNQWVPPPTPLPCSNGVWEKYGIPLHRQREKSENGCSNVEEVSRIAVETTQKSSHQRNTLNVLMVGLIHKYSILKTY